MSESLATMLAEDDDEQLCYSLVSTAPNYEGTPFHQRPFLVGLLGGLATLYLTVTRDGIEGFLDDDAGDGFSETVEWCRVVGARAATEYLEAVAALFLDGRVPRDSVKRFRVRLRLGRRRSGNPLTALDEQFSGAMPELMVALRSYCADQVDELDAAIAQATPATPPTELETLTAQIDRMQAALPTLQRMGESMHDRCAALHLMAQTRGLRPLDGTLTPKIEAFYGALGRLSVDDWQRLVGRAYAMAPKGFAAASVADEIAVDLNVGRLLPREQYISALFQPMMKAREPVFAQVRALPPTMPLDGEVVPFADAARLVLLGVTHVALAYDWLMVTRNGVKSVAIARQLLDGFAELPA